jgi:hypothetical protein
LIAAKNEIARLESVPHKFRKRNSDKACIFILNFLAQRDDRLQGRKPIDTLKQGKIDLVSKERGRAAAAAETSGSEMASDASKEQASDS